MTKKLNHITAQIQPPECLVAVSRVFTRAKKAMSLNEFKTLFYVLSQIRFTEAPPEDNIVYLDKKTLASILGIHSDTDHLSQDLLNEIGNLHEHSHIKIDKQDLGFYADGCVVSFIASYKNTFAIEISRLFMSMFAPLTKDYITLWSFDIFQMRSERSVLFYEHLRQITRTDADTNETVMYVKSIKELFDIPMDGRGSYIKRDGTFDRYNFEKFVIAPVCRDLTECKMLALMPQGDAYFERFKTGTYVTGYRFRWTYSPHPGTATAADYRKIVTFADGQTLKVAKDIVYASQRPKKARSSFHDYEQRSYDDSFYKALERKKLGLT